MDIKDYQSYAFKIEGDDKGGYVAYLRGIDGCFTGDFTMEKTLEMAKALVIDWAEFCFSEGKEMPPSAKPEKGDVMVNISEDAAAKIMVRNEIVSKGIKLVKVAEKLGIPQSQLSRNLKLTTSLKLSFLSRISNALGLKLDVTIA